MQTDNTSTLHPSNLIRMSRPISLTRLGSFTSRSQTEYVWDDVSSFSRSAFRLHPQRHLYVRLAFSIGVVFWVLAQTLIQPSASVTTSATGLCYLEDDKIIQLDFPFSNILSHAPQIFVDPLNDDLCLFTR